MFQFDIPILSFYEILSRCFNILICGDFTTYLGPFIFGPFTAIIKMVWCVISLFQKYLEWKKIWSDKKWNWTKAIKRIEDRKLAKRQLSNVAIEIVARNSKSCRQNHKFEIVKLSSKCYLEPHNCEDWQKSRNIANVNQTSKMWMKLP